MNSRYYTLLTLLLSLALFPIFVFAGEQMYNQLEFYNAIKNDFLFFGGLVLIVSIFLFYPYKYKFRKKEIDFSVCRNRHKKLFKILGKGILVITFWVLFVILLFISVIGTVTVKNLEVVLVIAALIAVFPLFIIDLFLKNYIRNLVGSKSPILEEEIGKFIKQEKPVLLYFCNEDSFKRELRIESIYDNNAAAKKIKEMDELVRKKSSDIKVFKIDPCENSIMFEKFKVSHEVNYLTLYLFHHRQFNSMSSKNRMDVPSIVIISEGYIKEYWIGHARCKLGLLNFNTKNIGNILNKIAIKHKVINITLLSLFGLFVIFLKHLSFISSFINFNTQISMNLFLLPLLILSFMSIIFFLKPNV